jgi:membrane peptidoglycan carboxypeptidase
MRERLAAAARWMGAGLVALIVAVAAFEAYALVRAKAHTPAALASVAARPVRTSELPPRWIHALLAVEDPGFYRHHGVDFATPGQGMTTITQSLVKHLYFRHFRPGFEKIEQDLIAWLVLDKAMSKADQLEAYINYTPYGHVGGRQVIGLQDAAISYYDRPATALSERQFLSILAMGPAPEALDPLRHAAANAERVARIERLLKGECRPRGLTDIYYPDCARR